MDSLGNKTELFVALQEAGFIKKTEDGKWDLTELSELIGTQVGDDARLNRDHKKDKLVAEKLNTKAALRVASGLSELDDSHAKALIKLCGYEIEGKNWGRAIFQGILGAAGGAAVTAGSAYGAAKMLPKDITFKQPYFKDKTYNISADLAKQLQGKLPEGVTIDASGSIHIITDIIIEGKLPRLAGELGKLGLYAAVPGALVGATLGILSGLEDKGQTPVLANNFTETTFEAYCENLKRTDSPYATIGIMIASSFVDENGNWDREGYKDFLNTMGGDKNCLINREELIGGLQKRLEKLNKIDDGDNKIDDNDNDDDNCVDKKCSVDVEEKPGAETVETTDNTYIHYRKNNPGVGWAQMVTAYYPGLVEACGGKMYGNDGAIRALQKALCTDENGVLDQAKLKALYTATDVPKEIKIPTKVNGIDRVIVKPTPAKKTTVSGNGSGKYIRPLDKVGRDEISSVKKVGPSTYLATDGCDGVTASGSSKSEAVANLKKTTGKEYENEGDFQ